MQSNNQGWRARLRVSPYWGFPALLMLVAGAVLAFAGQAAVHATNSLEFCVSCHEMRTNNFSEYSHTIHASNRTGVKATCADCHVPHETGALLVRKVTAANDVVQHLLGRIDTKEKFELHRLELAQRVWLRMKSTDSAECRHCHDTKAMNPEMQGKTAQKQHLRIGKDGKTCIDCHFGIAHKEPGGGAEPADVMKGPSDSSPPKPAS